MESKGTFSHARMPRGTSGNILGVPRSEIQIMLPFLLSMNMAFRLALSATACADEDVSRFFSSALSLLECLLPLCGAVLVALSHSLCYCLYRGSCVVLFKRVLILERSRDCYCCLAVADG